MLKNVGSASEIHCTNVSIGSVKSIAFLDPYNGREGKYQNSNYITNCKEYFICLLSSVNTYPVCVQSSLANAKHLAKFSWSGKHITGFAFNDTISHTDNPDVSPVAAVTLFFHCNGVQCFQSATAEGSSHSCIILPFRTS